MNEFLYNVSTSWILPDGQIYHVSSEQHDKDLPYPFKSILQCEKSCIRISCHWGFNVGASSIQVPQKFTHYQKQILNRIDLEIGIGDKLDFQWDNFPSSIKDINE